MKRLNPDKLHVTYLTGTTPESLALPRRYTLTHSDITGELFLNDNGCPFARSGVQQMLRRSGKRTGIIGVRSSPHTSCHTFARNYLLSGGDIFSLQKILGHSSLASVRTYLNLFVGDIKRQHQRFSSVDNMSEIRSMYPQILHTVY